MGPPQASSKIGARQQRVGRSPTSLRLQARKCLLKGCGRLFRADRWSQRYCGEECRAAATGWAKWRACRTYRKSDAGRAKRAQQSKRRRARARTVTPPPAGTSAVPINAEESDDSASEGHQPSDKVRGCCCARPGCYALFHPDRRLPLRRFCTARCREALRRVRVRECRWRQRTLVRRLRGG